MSQSLLRVGAMAALIVVLIAAAMITLDHRTFPMSGIGTLKCYTTSGAQKPC
jgi:hypothetical protein